MSKNSEAKRGGKRLQKRLAFDIRKFRAVLDENRKIVVDHAYSEAVYLALKAKHGTGILAPSPTHEDIAAMNEAMAPLVAVLKYEATASFARVLEGLLADSNLSGYLRRKAAAALGKSGGRPQGARAPHLEWLEKAMRTEESRRPNDIRPMSAKEHFQEVRHRPEIDGEDDDGNLTFSALELDKYIVKEGQKEPVISLSAVTETLTRIRKNL